ncbi:MAG: sigma 54-interacting transcriptional regulator, partial [Sphingomonadales bacterium]|nr:sigma 54-interacting transcriptional regulator [Sphingomonadales bacterium]
MKHDRILVVDDSSEVIKALSALLKLNQLYPICISSPDELTGALDKHQPNLVLLDMNYSQDTTSGAEGLDLIRKIRARDEQVPIVVMTAYANIPLVVEALKIGANDFIEKPWDNQRLLGVLRAQLDLADGRRREASWVQENNRVLSSPSSEYIFQSDAMTKLMDVVARVADSDAAILITGAHGTGKTQLARLIHSRSSRRHKPFIQVNVGALSDQLFESELFGHVKGAFTDA